MKRKILACALCLSVAASALAACANGTQAELPAKVENITYADGVLSYDEVKGATGYKVVFEHLGEVVYEDVIEDTAIDIESLGLYGNITVTVAARSDAGEGKETEYSFVSLSTFDDVIFEAEENLYNFGTGKAQSNFRNNTLAHKGAYVGGIDDAGQGVYINYLCPVAGTYEFAAYYCMDEVSGFRTAKNEVWINGKKQTEFIYDKITGWGGDRFDPEKSTVSVTLEKGWNTISVMKNGTQADNWGGFAELDYFVLTGDGSKYNPDELISSGVRPATYRLEAEMGSPRKKGDSGMSECKNPCIAEYGDKKFSNGFIMGNIEQNYDGVEWHFNSPVKAKYSVRIAYAAGQFDGSKKPSPTFIVSQEQVELFKNADFKKLPQQTMKELPYTDWGDIKLSEETVEIVLEADKNFIYCLLLDSADSGFFQIDYIELTFIEEVE